MPAIKTRTVPAISRAFEMMERIAESGAGLTLPELIEQSGLAKSSVHYLLVTLERCRYIERNPRTGRYVLADKIWKIARAAANHPLAAAWTQRDQTSATQPSDQRLRRRT